MKHLQTINEFYDRTIGFRYSEPKEKFKFISAYAGELTKQDLSDILTHYDVKFENIEIIEKSEVIELEGDMIELNGAIFFDLYVYSEKEIDSIVNGLGKVLINEFDVELVNPMVKPFPVVRKS